MADLEVQLYESITDINRNQWNNLVEQSGLGSMFHRYGWLQTIEEVLEYSPRHITISKRGNPVAVFPNFIRPLELPVLTSVIGRFRFTELISTNPGYGGPVIATDERDCLELLFDRLSDVGGLNVVHHMIVTNNLEYIRYGQFLRKRGYAPIMTTCRFRLHLDDWKEIQDGMTKERRKNLRNARKDEFHVRDEKLNDERLRQTHQEYENHMERINGKVFPLSFFLKMRDNLPNRLKVFTVIVDGQNVGSYVYFLDEERSTVHHYFSAIGDSDFFQYFPTELLHAHVIQWAIDQGYTYYDFGDTRPIFDDSVFKYKEQYGGRTIPTLGWIKGKSKFFWQTAKLGWSLYRKKSL